MAFQPINLDSGPNDNTGDDLRTGGGKINANFAELYARGYILPLFFTTTPTDGEVLLLHKAGADFTIPVDFTDALESHVGTSPTATFDLTVAQNGATIGTISVSTGGVVTATTTSGTAAQRSTFAYGNLPALGANEGLGEVFLWTRARNSGGAPSNVAPIRRTSGGTDNVGSNLSGISGAYQTFPTRYSGLTESEYNGSEFGVESAT